MRATESARRLPSRLQPGIDFLAGTGMIVAAGLIIWKVAFSPSQAGPSRQPPLPLPKEPVSYSGLPIDGDPRAPIGIIQYSEFQCPFCGKFARETLPAIRDKYLKPGKAFLAFVHFPLGSIHPRAAQAAAVAKCTQESGRFWPFHDRLFASSKPGLDDASLSANAAAIGLTEASLAECLGRGALDRVEQELAQARQLQVVSTPTFFFGVALQDGLVRVKSRTSGALPLSSFESILDGLGKEVALASDRRR